MFGFLLSLTVLTATATAEFNPYIYGYPIVLLNLTRPLEPVPWNFLFNKLEFPGPTERTVVKPNRDTLYSVAWLDLSKGPMLLSLPDTSSDAGRYYLFQVMDAWSNVVGSPGWRTTGRGQVDVLIHGPDSSRADMLEAHNGMVVSVPTAISWMLGRTEVLGEADLRIARKQMTTYRLNNAPTTPSRSSGASPMPALALSSTPTQRMLNMSAEVFAPLLAQMLVKNPPLSSDTAAVDALTALGITVGKELDWSSLPAATQGQWNVALRDGKLQLLKAVAQQEQLSGWSIPNQEQGDYGTDYQTRAVIAMLAYGANLLADAAYYLTETVLTGRENNTLVLAAPLPPVEAFWSVTLYDEDGFLFANDEKRYNVGSTSEYLIVRPDGAIVVQMSDAPPSDVTTTNWLPAPLTNFSCILRAYWPTDAIITGAWAPPAIISTA